MNPRRMPEAMPETGSCVDNEEGRQPQGSFVSHRPDGLPSLFGFGQMRMLAEAFDDAQETRIRNENRLRSAEQSAAVLSTDPLKHLVERYNVIEDQLRKNLIGAYHEYAPTGIQDWQQKFYGVGDSTVARLLGALGHPRIAEPHHWEGEGEKRKLIADENFERSLRQLWAYCGYGDPERKRRRGMTAVEGAALGNPMVKKLVYLIAANTIKCKSPAPMLYSTATPEAAQESSGSSTSLPQASCSSVSQELSDLSMMGSLAISPTADHDGGADPPIRWPEAVQSAADRYRYRRVYDAARLRYAEKEDWTLGHQHAAALRLVSKEILRDLWLVASA